MFVGLIVLWLEPLVFDLSPKYFNWIKMRAVCWEVPDEQPLVLPMATFIANGVGGMPPGIVEDKDCRAFDGLNKIIQAFDDKVCIDGLGGWIRAKLLV